MILRHGLRLLATIAIVATSALAAGSCGNLSPATDLMGGDISPLGAGFRNASSAADCCAACLGAGGCKYFTFAPKPGAAAQLGGRVPHNCWLKASAGRPSRNADRASGAASGMPLPPAPGPPNATDACFPKPTAPWCDASKSIEARVALLVKALTLEEKIVQISTFTPKTVPGVARVGLPPFSYHSEGLHGLRNSMDTLGFNATGFPQVTAMAATGNQSLWKAMGAVMKVEARALSNYATDRRLGPFSKGSGLFYWSPTMNIGRDPRWGRFQESVSEDPHLNGLYSSTLIQGFQGNDPKHLAVAATCKHFVGYSLEAADNFTRHNFDAVISAFDMQDTYLPAFKMCVTRGKPGQGIRMDSGCEFLK